MSDIEQRIKHKVEYVGLPLKDWDVQIFRGVLTGCNDAFVITSEQRDEILTNCTTEEERVKTAEIIRPILRGRDICRYGYNWADLWLINTHNGIKGRLERINIWDYPAIKQHLDNYWDKIKPRADQGDTAYNLRNCAYLDLLCQPKIVWGEISDKTKFCIDDSGLYYPEATTFMLSGGNLYLLLAFLNCSVSEYVFSKIGTTTGVGTVRWKKYKILELVVPNKLTTSQVNDIVNLCKKIVSLKKDNSSNTIEIERQLNYLIYNLYDLTEEEIEFIEKVIS